MENTDNNEGLVKKEDTITKSNPTQEEEVMTLQQIEEQLSLLRESIYAYSGPLPHPQLMREYNEIVPGSAERFINNLENEQKTRLSLNKTSTINTIIMGYIGILFAFLSVILISGLVYYSILKGFDKTATALGIGAIASVASVFVFFRRNKRKS